MRRKWDKIAGEVREDLKGVSVNYGTREKGAPHKLTNATQSLRYRMLDRQLDMLMKSVGNLMTQRDRWGEPGSAGAGKRLFCFHLPGAFRNLGPLARRGDRVVYRT